MTLEDPLWLGPVAGDEAVCPTYSAREWRLLTDGLVKTEGVVALGDLKVAQRAAGANLTVDIAAGSAFVLGDSITAQGKYQCRSNATENRGTGIISAPSSGTNHYLIALKVSDKLSDGGVDYKADIICVAPAAGGALAALPATAIPLADVAVAAGQSSIVAANITDLRTWASAIDGLAEWRGTATVTTGTDGRNVTTWAHSLGRQPLGGVLTVNNQQTQTGVNLPTHAVLDMDLTSASQLRVRVWTLVSPYVYNGGTVKLSAVIW